MRRHTVLGAAALAVVSVLGATGAAGAKPLPQHHYVASEVQLPVNNVQAAAFARNLDGEAGKDNALGLVTAALAAQGLDLAGMESSVVSSGQLLMLHTLRTSSLARSKAATWQVRYAAPTSEPDFSGSGSFSVDPLAPRSARIPATIKNHHVSTAAATVPLSIQLGAAPITLPLQRARIFATCGTTTCSSGRVNGAVLRSDIDSTLVPGLVAVFQPLVNRDCPVAPNCMDGSTGKTIVDLFDADHDLVITTAELLDNGLIQALLAPDVDLLNAKGAPGHDGVADALSFGIGFTGVRAKLG
jgi:hypothetical protein